MNLTLKFLSEDFSVCKLADIKNIDMSAKYLFICKTPQELSVLLPDDCLPEGCSHINSGWCGFMIVDDMDFAMVGILAQITQVLKIAQISILALSSYDTDYVFIKKSNLSQAKEALSQAGYILR